MAQTWEEILVDPRYANIIANIGTSLTLSAQGAGIQADYNKPSYSKTKWGALMTPELDYMKNNPKTVMQVLAGTTAGLSPQDTQKVVSGTVGSMGQKWGGTKQDTAGKILEEKLIEMGELGTSNQGWMSNLLGYVENLAESSGVSVGGLLESVGQTMEDDEWSPFDD